MAAIGEVDWLKISQAQHDDDDDDDQEMAANKYQKFDLNGESAPGEANNINNNNNQAENQNQKSGKNRLRDLLNVCDFQQSIEREYSRLKKTPIGYLSIPFVAPGRGEARRKEEQEEAAGPGDENRALAASSKEPGGADSTGAGRPLSQAAASRAKFAIRSYTISGALPKRSRSLVDDARLDRHRNRVLLDEIRSEVERQQSLLDEQLEPGQQVVEAAASQAASSDIKQPPISQAVDTALGEPVARDGSLDEGDGRQLPARTAVQLAERCLVDFPRHISELDHCNHLLIKYEPELDPTHPGFHDLEYRARRKEVAQVAFNYKHGERIPEVAYNSKELDTWRFIYLRLKEAYAKYACRQHLRALAELEASPQAQYGPDRIPQLQQVSEFLEQKTGWRLRPVAGLLSARDFLASLAFRVFQTTQYLRHWGNPEHSVEPDCIHELMGHIPMLCDPEFAQFSQELGLASLGASDEQIEKFATLYWFTVEFGLCREQGEQGGQLKCYGAGLLSSYGEMEHALESGRAHLKEFVPEETAVEQYDDADYQLVYYVASSFDEAKAKIKEYAQRHLERDFELAYDPFSNSIRQLDSLHQLNAFAQQVRNDVARLSVAINKLKVHEAKTIGAAAAAAAAGNPQTPSPCFS